MTFEAALLKFLTKFSSWSTAPFMVSCVTPLIGLIMELSPSCKAKPRAFPKQIKIFPYPFLFGYISVHVWHHVHMKICLALFMSNHSGDCIKSLSL